MTRNKFEDIYSKYSAEITLQACEIVDGLRRTVPSIAAICLFLASVTAFAAAGNDAALTTVGEMFATAMTLGLALVAAVIFIIVAWAVVTKFNDARRGRADWGEVVLPFIIGAGVVIFVGWLVTEGTTAVGNIGI